MNEILNYGKQSVSEDDIEFVNNVLRSDFLTQGPIGKKFESAFSQNVGSKYATAFNSATSALHAACLALGVGSNDYVWTSPISFVASANCAVYCGAKVDFVDINLSTYNIDPELLQLKLEQAEVSNKLPKVLIVVHMCGHPCDMSEIYKLTQKYGIKVIEDASHATGATYGSRPVGSCEFSDIAVFSFHPVKIITTGEGGIATTNSQELNDKLALFRSHGVTRDSKLFLNKDCTEQKWYYEQHFLGYNYRLSDINAALGLAQLRSLDNFVKKRNQLASFYTEKISGFHSIEVPKISANRISSFHLYIIRVNFSSAGEKVRMFKFFEDRNVNLNVHYIPIHTQPYFKNLGFNHGDYPVAEKYYFQAVSLPIYPELDEEDIIKVIDILSDFLT